MEAFELEAPTTILPSRLHTRVLPVGTKVCHVTYVWVVKREPYFDDPVIGVFSSEAKALGFIEEQQVLDEASAEGPRELPIYDYAQLQVDQPHSASGVRYTKPN